MAFSTDDDEEVPPGYYSTVRRPEAGATLPEPPGPRTRLARIAFGVLFVVGGLGFAAVQLLHLADTPLSRASTSFAVSRVVAMTLVPAVFVLIGVVLLRGRDDPARFSRSRRNRR